MHGFSHVLEVQRPHILEREVKFGMNVAPGVLGQPDPARLGHLLQARCDIHAIAVKVVFYHHHVTEIDADPHDQAALERQQLARLVQPGLDRMAAAHCVDGTGEFRTRRPP